MRSRVVGGGGHVARSFGEILVGVGGDRTDFFISHAGADRAWAEWVAWELAEAGYTVELDVWDWAAGRNFVTAMSDALGRCDRVVALFSAAYFDRSRYTTEEWAASLVHLPGVRKTGWCRCGWRDVPAGQVPPLLRPLVARDVFGHGGGAGPAGAAGGGGGPGPTGSQAGVSGARRAWGVEQAGRSGSAAARCHAAGVECPGPQSGVHRP